jgi:NAD(P)H-flavin reductase
MTPALNLPTRAANPWLPKPAVIESLTTEASQVATYCLRLVEGRESAEYAFAAGQFNMLYVPGCGEAAISMSGSPTSAGGWVHTIRRAGQVTSALARLHVGDQVGVRGPFGRPWPLARYVGWDIVLIAGGIGLAPLRPVIYELLTRRHDFGRLVLLYGARTAADLLFTHEFDAWRAGGLIVQTTVDRATAGWMSHVGVVPLLLSSGCNCRDFTRRPCSAAVRK